MKTDLFDLFTTIAPPTGDNPNEPLYAVMPVPGYGSYFVGKDHQLHACLLVSTNDQSGRHQAPIRLESLDVQFELSCQLKKNGKSDRKGNFTVIRCRSLDQETIHYFLSICETILNIIGDKPIQRTVASIVNRLAAIFQKMHNPPTRTVKGLFGELFLIELSNNPVRSLSVWRMEDTARFDFTDGDIRLDVKVTGGRIRAHTFSYEQCSPPQGTIAIVASMFVERSPNGSTLRSLISKIKTKVAINPDLVFKLQEVVATTLGTNLNESLDLAFDVRIASSSLCFFNLLEIPAIREPLPVGISDVHFRSDLTSLNPLSIQYLIDKDPAFWDLLPSDD